MKRLLVCVIAAIAALSLAGCGSETYTWNQKLTVVVETPGGERSGSAVMQVTARIGEGSVIPTNAAYKVEGEATVVDLGHGKYLFALLARVDRHSPEYWAVDTFMSSVMDSYPYTAEDLNKFYGALENIRATRTVKPDHYPLLVTFSDLASPKTVKVIKPGELSKAFGSGYRLKSVSLEMTDERVAKGKLRKVLPWIETNGGALVPTKLKPAPEYGPEEELSAYQFDREG